MLKIRLQRVGRKHDPSFRVVLTDRRNATKSGKFLEVLGSYNARFGSPVIKADRVLHWIKMGAQPSDTVHNLLINEKVIEGKKRNVLPKKSPIIKEVKEEDKKEEVATTATEEKEVKEEKKEEVATPVVEEDSKKEAEVEEKTEEPSEQEKNTSEEEPKVEESSDKKENKSEEVGAKEATSDIVENKEEEK